ncbi:glycosyltransferase family 8 protein [Clostridium polynesiense]|uniref:glycosyltransferase family 8 protein n=1 Tax=Clostridium polynesiense TaxID=1325933 RepID=UPI00058B113E|nr:glycosyltransferase family 8 protein [Clostridium polynesiense]
MNILVTLNSNYIKQLIIMMNSLLKSNPTDNFKFYIAHSSLTKEDLIVINSKIDKSRCEIIELKINLETLNNAPVSKRYPKEMYYRIFAAQYLPRDMERILYLDPDIVVINPIKDFYNIDFKGKLYAASSHLPRNLRIINTLRLNLPSDNYYINSGVMLMNLSLLRENQDMQQVFDYIEKYKNVLLFPDQDVINGVYCNDILPVDPLKYNLSEKYYMYCKLRPVNYKVGINIDWVRSNTCIIHYSGKNKPWKRRYIGELGVFYNEIKGR